MGNGTNTSNPSTLAALVSASVARWPPPESTGPGGGNLQPAALPVMPTKPGKGPCAITATNLVEIIASTVGKSPAEAAQVLEHVIRDINAIAGIALRGFEHPPGGDGNGGPAGGRGGKPAVGAVTQGKAKSGGTSAKPAAKKPAKSKPAK